jgi:septal ring factor EnvC (AmiA/AmiB activator)
LFIAELETRVDQLKASKTDLKNLFYREQEARQVLEYDYKELAYKCDKHMELRIASDRDLVNCYKSLQKLNEDCEKLRAQLKELEEAALPIARLLVPHPGGPKIAPLVDWLKEAPSRLATYVKHIAKSIPNQVLTDKTCIHLRSASVQTYTFFTTRFPRFLSIRGARGLLALNQVLI